MDVLLVTAELAPYARVTDAGDVVFALAKGLRQVGHRVTIALPRYAAFEEHGLLLARRLTPLSADGADVTVFDGQLSNGVELVLFDIPGLAAPGDLTSAAPDPRTLEAFSAFGRAAAALVRQRREQQPFDVVHAHDWPGGLVGPHLGAGAPPLVLSVYDVRRRLLEVGLAHARAVVSPAPSYAARFGDEAVSGALAGAFARLPEPVIGIASGVDYATYNPATDPSLEARYDAEEASAKARTKGVVLRELRLELDILRPLLVCAGPLDRAHGADVLLEALPELARLPAALVVGGVGARGLLPEFQAAAAERPHQLACVAVKDDAALRRLYAAADLALVLPREAPCETAQLVAQRYGALPVAHAVDTVLDTVVDCDAALETGTGFLFDGLDRASLVGAVERGLAAHANEAGWTRLRRRVMRLDLGWDRPARRYAQIYRRASETASS
ncbi:MAG TPA: glycogen/starch synthase [Polyangiaceae bacterium]|nr:glycogen/starch synthase [Polyangiaceae bacterium]